MSREEILEALLEEAMDRIDYALYTPDDRLWLSKVTDFQASVGGYLRSGQIDNLIYPHSFLGKINKEGEV
jgi:hypothetical protein